MPSCPPHTGREEDRVNRELPPWARTAQAKWKYRGQERPPFALEPLPGQESVWDYPRPPMLVPDRRRVIVQANGQIIAESRHAFRVLETASPPTFYLPPHDVDKKALILRARSTQCEWKGIAYYWCVHLNGFFLEDVGWSYLDPYPEYALIAGYVAFHPGRVYCVVDREEVIPQPGSFYGGWVTSEIVGPFKGEQGTEDW